MSLYASEFFEIFGDALEKQKFDCNPRILLKDQYFDEDPDHGVYLYLVLEINGELTKVKVSSKGCFFAEDEPEDLIVERGIHLGLSREDVVARLNKFWEKEPDNV